MYADDGGRFFAECKLCEILGFERYQSLFLESVPVERRIDHRVCFIPVSSREMMVARDVDESEPRRMTNGRRLGRVGTFEPFGKNRLRETTSAFLNLSATMTGISNLLNLDRKCVNSQRCSALHNKGFKITIPAPIFPSLETNVCDPCGETVVAVSKIRNLVTQNCWRHPLYTKRSISIERI